MSKQLLTKSNTRIEGTVIVQAGRPMLMGAMPASELERHRRVDIYDPNTQTGYQRKPVMSRVRKAARYYAEKGGKMPNPLLVNIRAEDFDRLELVVHADSAGFEEALDSDGDWIGFGYVDLPDDLALWIYDGQHRAEGMKVILEDYADVGDFGSFPIPLSITLGLGMEDEMTEFYEVNTNAKAVRTDLAWQLLKEMAEHDSDLAERLEMEGRDWVTKGIKVIEALDSIDGPWKGRIGKPNTRVRRNDPVTIPQAQFVKSLRPVLDMPLLAKADPAKIAQLLNAYWTGIRQVLPEPFDPKLNPKDYAIQKGQGTTALHRVLPQAIEVIRSKGLNLGDPDLYAEVMKDLPNLSGEIITQDGNTEEVTGADFWKTGSEGVASQFSGDAGRKRLSVHIRNLMPRPADELVL